MNLQRRVTGYREVLVAIRDACQILWAETDTYAKNRLAAAFALVIGSGLLAASAPIAYKLIVDALTGDAGMRAYVAPGLLIAAYVASQYFLKAFGALRECAHELGEQRLHRHLSRRLFAHLVSLPMSFHLNRKTGALGETLTQGLNGYQMIMQNAIYAILPVSVEFLAIAVVLIHFDHTEYLVILGMAAVSYAVAFGRGAASVTEPARAVSSAHIDAHSVLTDSLLNYETVKYFDAESIVRDRYDEALAQTESAWRIFFRRRVLNSLVVATIFAASLGASLAYAAREVIQGTMTIGDFVLINSYVLRLVQPLETVGYAVRDISQGLAFLQKLLELFREKPEGNDALADAPASNIRGEITFDEVSFCYRPDRVVLKNVSFSVARGQTVAVVGVSGSGKSSLVRLLFRLYEPVGGRIVLDSTAISEIPLSTLRQAIAVVPQDTLLFNDSIGNNIALGKHGCHQQEIEYAAKLAHLHEFIMGLPERYDTRVGERGLKLSGGERQRVAIARAALKQPRIYVFDEATSSLDSKTEREILHNLVDVSKSSTTLVIAHRLSTVVHADEIVVLDRGEIVERGTHAELLARNGKYTALWRAQHSGRVDPGTLEMSVAEFV